MENTTQMYFPDGTLAPQILKVEELARLFNISEDSIYKAIRDGHLYARKFTVRQFRIAQADAIAWFYADG